MGPMDFIQGGWPQNFQLTMGKLLAPLLNQGGTQVPAPQLPMMPQLQPPATQDSAVTLGQYPQLQGPTNAPGLAQVDLKPMQDLIAGSASLPEFIAMEPPPARPHAQPMDFGPMRAAMVNQRPRDTRLSARERSGNSFADAMAAAAGAASGASNLGELLAGAGSAFGGAYHDNREHNRAEDVDFEDRQRAFDLSLAQTDFEIARAQNDFTNADNETTYAEAMDRYQTALANKQGLEARQMEQREAKRQAAGQMLDLAQIDVGQKNAAAQLDFQNKEAQRSWANEQAMRQVPNLQWTEQGVRRTWIDKDGTMKSDLVSTTPFEEYNRLEQMANAVDPITAAALRSQFGYNMLEKVDPGRIKQKLIVDILSHPKGEQILDPNEYLPPADFGEGIMNMGGYVQDVTTTSIYERALDAAKKYVDAQVAGGRIPSDQADSALRSAVAMTLENSVTPEMLARARTLNDPAINTGLEHYNKYFGPMRNFARERSYGMKKKQ